MGLFAFVFILVNAINCRFQFWIADAFTRYTVQTAIICVCGYKLKYEKEYKCDILVIERKKMETIYYVYIVICFLFC